MNPACSHHAPESCRRCDGTSGDEWEQIRADRDAEKTRERRMRTDPTFRLAWLESFPPEYRAGMASMADRRFGRMDLTTDEQHGGAA